MSEDSDTMPLPERIFLMINRCLTVVLVSFLASIVAPSVTNAADSATAQARVHSEKGRKFFNLGQWDDAIAEYQEAYKLREDPAFLFNLAQAYRRKGDPQRALDLYKNYLIENPRSPKREEIEKRIDLLEKEMKSASVRPSSSTGFEASAPASTASPAALAPPLSPAEGGPMPPDREAVPSTTKPVLSNPEASAELSVRDSSGRGLRVAGLVCGGVGVASLATAIYYYTRATSLSDKVTNADVPDPSDHKAGKDAMTMQWIFYSVGAAALGTGAVLYWLGLPSAKVAPVATPGMVGLTAGGTF